MVLAAFNKKAKEVISGVLRGVRPVVASTIKEGFAESQEDEATIANTILAGIYTFMFGGMLLFAIIGYGSARLSFCYNQSIGTSIELMYIYAAICFVFPYIYYPYYSIMLNPLCIKKTNVSAMRR
jgi:hypothetical protein